MNHPDPKNSKKLTTILIADDDDDDILLITDILGHIDPGVKAEVVRNGLDLLSLLSHFVPDLLFLDLDMPGKNGLECLVEIRANPIYASMPVVIFSSTSRPANIETAYEMGADLFFIKPANYQDLIVSMRAILALDWGHPAKVKEQYLVNGRYQAFA